MEVMAKVTIQTTDVTSPVAVIVEVDTPSVV